MLQQVQLFNFRCFSQFNLECSPRLTVISGQNGAGKTSLLEAIFHLSSFRSFRTREIQPLIREGSDFFVVRGLFDQHHKVVIKKTLKAASTLLLDDKPLNATSILAKRNPMTIIHQGLFELVDGGASARRMTLDWGLFHVEHSYHAVLSSYNHALKQRNALLKRHATYKEIEPWDTLLSSEAEKLLFMRDAYVKAISPIFEAILYRCANMHCTLESLRGWGRKEQPNMTLYEYLRTHFEQDAKQQHTRYGAHAADLRFVATRSAKKEFSRGQQTMLFFALKLAQIAFLESRAIVLLDDVFAELDSARQQSVMQELANLGSQVIMTALEPQAIILDSFDNDYRQIHLS